MSSLAKALEKIKNRKQKFPLNPATWRCEHRHTGLEHPMCWYRFLQEHMDQIKIGYWDIETSNIDADFGWIISWAIKPRDEDRVEGYVLQKKDFKLPEADYNACLKLVEALSKYDMIVTWYGSKFDRRFAFTRVLINGLQWFPPKTKIHLDLYYQAKRLLKLSSLRLKAVGETFESFGLTEKTAINRKVWRTISRKYDKEALAEIWDHNYRDVVLLEQIHKILEPYIKPTARYL